MGWNSWNCLRHDEVTAQAILDAASAMAENGMRDVGYNTVVIDDHWQQGRDRVGRLVAHRERFPDGIEAVTDAIHDLGMRVGIYSVPGSTTCGQFYDSYPADDLGSLGRERLDAQTFASWNIDFLKYDWCRAHLNDGIDVRAAYELMSSELHDTGRDIVLSISEYGIWKPWEWAYGVANMWRTTDDLKPTWWSLASTIVQQYPISQFSRPGGWNDPDMLQVGNGSLTTSEVRTHLSAWAITNAPLMAGNDPRQQHPDVSLMLNPDMVAIDQDWGGTASKVYGYVGDNPIFAKPMSTGGTALAILNLHDRVFRADLRPHLPAEYLTTYREAWTGAMFDEHDFGAVELAPHDSHLLRPIA